MKIKILTFLFSACLLVGCAGPKAARKHANLLAANTARMQNKAENYAAARDRIVKARKRNQQNLERDALRLRQQTELYVRAWEIAGDKERLELFNRLKSGADMAAAQRAERAALLEHQEKVLAETQTLFSVRAADLEAAAAALAELGRKPDPEGSIRFLVGFMRDVDNSMDDANEQAAAQATEGASAADSFKVENSEEIEPE